MKTTEFRALRGFVQRRGGDSRTQIQLATLTSMVSGIVYKKPLSPKDLMPDYPWPRKTAKKAAVVGSRALAMAGRGA